MSSLSVLSRPGLITVVLFALSGVFMFSSGSANAQTTSQTNTSPGPGAETGAAMNRDDAPKDAGKDGGVCGGKIPCLRDKFDLLTPPLVWRIGRGLGWEYKILEQAGTVGIANEAGITEFLPNPQDDLHQHTLTFKFSELFPDHLSMFKRGSDYLKRYPDVAGADGNKELARLLCDDNPLITCLSNGRGFWRRALMGFSLNAGISQRVLVQQGILVTPDTLEKKYQFTAGGVFDPAKLLPSVTNWKATFDELHRIDKALALLGAEDVVGRKSLPWKKKRWRVLALIPRVEFKMITQFDFVKSGNVFVDAPFPEAALNTWGFTWDLTRFIPDAKSRIDADALDEALEILQRGLGREEKKWQKRCILHISGEATFRDVKDLHPAFSAESCQELAQMMKAKEYQLSCFLDGAPREDGPKRLQSEPPAEPTNNSCRWIMKSTPGKAAN